MRGGAGRGDRFAQEFPRIPQVLFETGEPRLQCEKAISHMAAAALVPSPRVDPRHACFQLSIRQSRIHCRGVYAEESIPARHKVIEYTGERIGRRETLRRGQGLVTYLFTLDNYWTIDGSVGGSGAEIINHSCDPNLCAWIFKGHILYMSKRDIERGEELSVDYRFSKKVELVRCRCGAANCRGTINLP